MNIIVGNTAAAPRTVDRLREEMLSAIRQVRDFAVSAQQMMALRDAPPLNLTEYRLGRIAAWAMPRYAIDRKFVELTLTLGSERSGSARERAIDFQSKDLR